MEEIILWFKNLNATESIGVIGGIITIIGAIIGVVKYFSKIPNTFKWLFSKIWKFICTLRKWITAKCEWLCGKFQKAVTTISGSDKKNRELKKETEEKIFNLNVKFNQEMAEVKKEIEELKTLLHRLSNEFTDPRDGRKYRTAKIGKQVWFAENLSYAVEDSRRYGEDKNKDENNLSIDEIQANGEKYGRLYDLETAKKAVPPGWHLPTNEEWQVLVNFIGGEDIAGKKLKATSEWQMNGNGTDDYNFAALPGGFGRPSGSFDDIGYDGYWWSASEYDDSKGANTYYMKHNSSNVNRDIHDKTLLCSVRCIRD